MTTTELTVSTIIEGPNVRDEYNPTHVRKVYEQADYEARGRLRYHFRNDVESGRFWEFLDMSHDLLAHSDYTRRNHFTAHSSAWHTEWIATYGVVEDLSTFPNVTGIQK